MSKSFLIQTDFVVQEFFRHFSPYNRQGNIVAAQSSDCFLRLNIKQKFIRATKIYMDFLSHNNSNVSFVIWISKTNRFPLQGLGCK